MFPNQWHKPEKLQDLESRKPSDDEIDYNDKEKQFRIGEEQIIDPVSLEDSVGNPRNDEQLSARNPSPFCPNFEMRKSFVCDEHSENKREKQPDCE